MKIKGVVDRFEGDQALILLGDEEEQLVMERAQLPPGTREGHWLQIELVDDVPVRIEIDEEETARTERRIAAKMNMLRRGEHLKGQ